MEYKSFHDLAQILRLNMGESLALEKQRRSSLAREFLVQSTVVGLFGLCQCHVV